MKPISYILFPVLVATAIGYWVLASGPKGDLARWPFVVMFAAALFWQTYAVVRQRNFVLWLLAVFYAACLLLAIWATWL